MIVDLETKKAKFYFELPMVDSMLEPQKSPINTESPEGSLTMTKISPSVDKEPITPKWLETSIEKKWSIVPLSMPIDDLVSKFLGRTSKVKKARTESRIPFDKSSRHWSAKIAMPLDGSS